MKKNQLLQSGKEINANKSLFEYQTFEYTSEP